MAKWDTVTDDFPGSSLGALWNGSFGGVTVSGNAARCPNGGYSGFDSVGHDLSSSSVIIKVEALATGYCGLLMRDEPSGDFVCELNYIGSTGVLTARYYGSNWGGSDESNTVNLGAGARTIWLRHRHDGTALRMEYSADGTSWAQLEAAVVAASVVDDVEAYIDVGPDPDGGSAGSVPWSKLNLPPTGGPVALDGSAAGATSTSAELGVALALSGRASGGDGAGRAILVPGSAYGRYNLTGPAVATDVTVACWCKPTATTASQAVLAFNTGPGGNAPEIFWRNSGNRFTLFHTSPDTFIHEPAITRALDEWYHLCLTVTAAGVITLYVDGAQVQQATGINVINSPVNGYTLCFGQEFDGGTPSNFFNGWLDEGLLFHRVITAGELASLADRAQGEAGYLAAVAAMAPYAWWPMAEASGSTMVDASGNGRDGTYVGSPWFDQAGAVQKGPAPELGFIVDVSASASGSTSTSAELGFVVPLDGSAAGASTADGSLDVAVALSGEAAGATTTTAELVSALALTGTSDGALGTSAELDRQPALQGTATGSTAVADATLTVVVPDGILVAHGQAWRAWGAAEALVVAWHTASAERAYVAGSALRPYTAGREAIRSNESRELVYGSRGALLNR